MNNWQKVWDERYLEEEYIYGREPNLFFKNSIDKITPGKILLPADGEGRNSVYAAINGWDCYAYDFSETAKNKALKLAKENSVKINYAVHSHKDFVIKDDYFDVVALIFVHLPTENRTEFHKKIQSSIKVGGKIILQAFSKKQIDYNSGGPKDINLLYSLDNLIQDFSETRLLHFEERFIDLNEGKYHSGYGWVVELIAQKT